jgi:F-box and leucine-rich repeat protein 9
MLAGMTCHRWKEATQYPYATEIALTFAKMNFTDTQTPAKLFINSSRDFPVMSFESVEFGQMQEFWERFGESVRELNFKVCEIREKKFLQIMRHLSSLDTLRIEGCRELFMSGRLFENDEDKKDIAAAFRTLRTLSLAHNRYLSDALFSRIVALTTSLENLDLSGCCISFHKGLYKKFYPAAQLEPSESVLTFHYISQFLEQCAAKIKQLNFSSTLIDGASLNILADIDNLRLDSLNLKACDQLTNTGILSLVAQQTQLQYLDLSMSLRITDQSLIAIAGTLVELKSLKIRRCRALTDLGVKELVKLAHLEVLDISECESITGQGITEGIASKQNPRIKQIYVSALNICENSIIKMIESFPNLVVFDVSFCFNAVTDLVIQMIFKNLIWLRHLNLDLCDKVSDGRSQAMWSVFEGSSITDFGRRHDRLGNVRPGQQL